MVSTVLNTLALAASAAALTTSPAGTQNGCYWTVPNVGNFNTQFSISFASTSALIQDLSYSLYTVASGNSPFARRFDQTNIGYNLTNGAVTLTVPGGQTSGPISSSQLVSSYSDILYGSVRTVAMVSNVPGTTHGFTFYSNDTQEIDFAFLTGDTTMVHLTNEQVNSSSAATSYTQAAPSDATKAFHEYRVDWVPGASKFYIDGVLVQTITSNVPSTPGMWVWNNWSNGNAWAGSPPKYDSVLQIQSINAYVNRTSVDATILSGSAVCKVSSSSSSTVASSTKTSSSSTSAAATVVAVAATSTSSSSSSVKASTTSAASTSTAKTSSTSTSASKTSSASSSGATEGAVCDGAFYPTIACASGLTCTYYNYWYSYCETSSTSNKSTNSKFGH
ncbi:hypothetical protein MBLNU459_g6980t1 [Dothideomycetes sp. NU459]